MIKRIMRILIYVIDYIIYTFLMLLPIKKRVIASSFYGKKYENNSRYIVEELHELNDDIPIYWIQRTGYDFTTPSFIHVISNKYQIMYYYATSQIWVDTHNIPLYVRRRKKQYYLYSYHAGVGVKKTASDLYGVDRRTDHNSKNVSLAIANSNYLVNLLRGPMNYKGEIEKCGLPKNDILFKGNYNQLHKKICRLYGLNDDTKIVVYAPSHRQGKLELNTYSVPVDDLLSAFNNAFGGDWAFLVHLHPAEQGLIENLNDVVGENIIDANNCESMQELMLAADAFISDYSSSIFEVAPINTPCFIFAKDYYSFVEKRDLYFKLDDLPFPIAYTNEELINNVLEYNAEHWIKAWNDFSAVNGIYESGDSSRIVANRLLGILEYSHK